MGQKVIRSDTNPNHDAQRNGVFFLKFSFFGIRIENNQKEIPKQQQKNIFLENSEFRNEIVKDETEAENGHTYWGNLYHDFTYEFGAFHDIIMSFREIMDLYSTEVILILIGQLIYQWFLAWC